MTIPAAAPQISIVIPALNEASQLPRLLEQLAAWRQAGDEIIVVDGGSEDATAGIAAAAGAKVIQAPSGRATQMNAGAQHAGGKLLWFVHADTSLDASHRTALLKACERGAKWGRFDVRFADAAGLMRVIAWCMNWRSHLTHRVTGDQCLFVERKLFRELGGFALVALMEDIELSARLSRCAPPWRLYPRVGISARRWQRGGVVRTIALMWWLRLAYALGVPTPTLARWYGYRTQRAAH